MFFFPFSDDNPATNRPYICYILIGISCFIFLWQATLPTDLNNNAIYNFGVVPASLLGEKEAYIPSFLTIFSSMFMHGGWMHLIGNMVFLWIFGDNVEDSMGRVKFICFYLLSGIAAALLQAIIDPTSIVCGGPASFCGDRGEATGGRSNASRHRPQFVDRAIDLAAFHLQVRVA